MFTWCLWQEKERYKKTLDSNSFEYKIFGKDLEVEKYKKNEEQIIIPNKLQPETFKIEKLWDYETGEEIDSVSPGVKGQKVFMKLPIKCEEGWILRRKKLSKGTPLFDQ